MDIDTFETSIGIAANFIFFATTLITVIFYFSKIGSRFDSIDVRFDNMDTRIDTRFDGIDARFDNMDARFDKQDARIDKLTADVEEIKSYTKFSDSQSNQIRDLRKENRKTSEEFIKVKIAVENMGTH